LLPALIRHADQGATRDAGSIRGLPPLAARFEPAPQRHRCEVDPRRLELREKLDPEGLAPSAARGVAGPMTHRG